jgi:predicted DNA-binding transcriptional regulator YafY
MFCGKEERVEMIFHNTLTGVVVDFFGKDVKYVKIGENHLNIHADICISPVFKGWIFQFGDKVKITYPQSLIDELAHMAENMMKQYRNG